MTVNSQFLAMKSTMDTKCYSTYAHTRPISSFLKDTSAAPNNKVFVCIPYREALNRCVNKRKASRQLAPDHPPILPDILMPINIRVETSIPVEILIPPPLLARSPPESRL
jgi:hypothetical protein